MAKTTIQLIANGLAKDFNLSAAEATTFVEAFFNIVSEELKNGNQVKIKGLGTFKVQSVKPRECVTLIQVSVYLLKVMIRLRSLLTLS